MHVCVVCVDVYVHVCVYTLCIYMCVYGLVCVCVRACMIVKITQLHDPLIYNITHSSDKATIEVMACSSSTMEFPFNKHMAWVMHN